MVLIQNQLQQLNTELALTEKYILNKLEAHTQRHEIARRVLKSYEIKNRIFHHSIEDPYSQLMATFSNIESSLIIQKEKAELLRTLIHESDHFLASVPDLHPVNGYQSSAFGHRKSPFDKTWMFHKGMDIAAPTGSEIRATGNGIVKYASYSPTYGRFIIIDHGFGIETKYAHNKKNLVKMGDYVFKGQKIATIGSTGRSTGPHLHYEVIVAGQHVDPQAYITHGKVWSLSGADHAVGGR